MRMRPARAQTRNDEIDKDFVPFLDLLHERCQLLELASGVDYRPVLSSCRSRAHTLVKYLADEKLTSLVVYILSKP